MNYIPIVIEQENGQEKSYDIYSRLLKDRIIILQGEINDQISTMIVSELLFLSSESDEDINLYINSPGGSITAGLAIFDTMNFIKPNVNTICLGLCASMASILLAAGAKRYSLENGEIMIHQPLGGCEGQATDIEIATKRLLRTKEKIIKIMAKLTGQNESILSLDMERDFFLTAKEAKEYGIIDEILRK